MALTVDSGETATIQSGFQAAGSPVNIGGELNVDGELFTADAVAKTASGVGEASGTATLDRRRDIAAVGLGEAYGIRSVVVSTGDSETLASGRRRPTAGPLNIGGEFNVGGSLSVGSTIGELERVRSLLASGLGEGVGTADLERVRDVAASGVGEGVGAAGLRFGGILAASGTGDGIAIRRQTISAGTTETIDSGDTRRTGGINLDGELNVGGRLDIRSADAKLVVGRELDASGIGDGVGTADLARFRDVAASGFGEAVGAAALIEAVSTIRGNAFGVDFDETESFDLNADRE